MGASKINEEHHACFRKLLKLLESRNAGVKKSLHLSVPRIPFGLVACSYALLFSTNFLKTAVNSSVNT